MGDDVRLMTYAEAASVLRVKVDSVKRRARNRRWHREIGNDGLTRIAVPLSALPDDPPDVPADVLTDSPPDISGDVLRLEKQVSALESEVRMLRESQDDLRADRDAWRDLANRRWWHGFIRRSHRQD